MMANSPVVGTILVCLWPSGGGVPRIVGGTNLLERRVRFVDWATEDSQDKEGQSDEDAFDGFHFV